MNADPSVARALAALNDDNEINLCRHGGKKQKPCSIQTCPNQAVKVKGEVCVRHGAKKHKHKGCTIPGCTNIAKKGGVSKGHANNDGHRASTDTTRQKRRACAPVNGDDGIAYVRQQIENDEPALVKLKIGPNEGYYFPRCGDWEEIGTLVGENTHVKELEFSGLKESGVVNGDVDKFFNGLVHGGGVCTTGEEDKGHSRNKSIQTMIFRDCSRFDGVIFNSAMPFFANNQNVKYLEVDDCDLVPRGETLHNFLRVLTSSVLSDLNSVGIFKIPPCHEYSGACRSPLATIRALAGHNGLKKLILWRSKLEHGKCAAVAFLLNETNDLVVLDLYCNCVDDEAAAFLWGESNLKDLDAGRSSVSENIGWRSVSAIFRSPHFKMEQLLLLGRCTNDCVASRALYISGLRSFYFRRNPSISVQTLFRVLQNGNCIMKDLDFCGHSFNDDTAVPLLISVMNNSSLKSLNLSGSLRHATDTTWQSIAALLQRPQSALEKINLCYSPLNNAALVSFTCALANNKKLTELMLYNSHDWNTRWGAFSRLLCNKSSIMDTFNSNHTLHTVTASKTQPDTLETYLELNQQRDKFDVARKKIIMTHFTGDMNIDMQHFIDMKLEVLPQAIAWLAGGEVSLFYEFVRNMPLFFESGGKQS